MVTQDKQSKCALPRGVVTLLFTDMEGSSRQWEQHGDHFIPVWQAHDAILRDAVTRFRGYEVKSEGDAFMVAFADPADAVHCALFAQAALARYPWPPDIDAPRVRMGIHTGEPFVQGNDYFGPMVNRSARICSAAHGGQVLVSEESRCAAWPRLDPKVTFMDLGEHRLKDMGTPQRLHQADHPSVEARSFPPLRSLECQPNNLPVQRTSFVGRAPEIEQIASYLAQGEKPVLTLTGPGGIGKTRLSLEAAAAHAEWFPDGVWYVRLVEAKDIVGASVEIAAAMNIPLPAGRPPLEQVRDWLANRRCLLILDDANNFPYADRLIRELLSGATNLRCLATARESLQIAEATDMAISGLQTQPRQIEAAKTDIVIEPEPAPQVTLSDAERLFVNLIAEAKPAPDLPAKEWSALKELLALFEGAPANIEHLAQLVLKNVAPTTVLDYLKGRMASEQGQTAATGLETSKSRNLDKFKHILRSNAQKVKCTVEEHTLNSMSNLGQLLQGIATVATDRKDAATATDLGRESLRLSQAAGDECGVAAALRQLARVYSQQGDRQSASALLHAAAQIYVKTDRSMYLETQRELEKVQSELQEGNRDSDRSLSLEHAVALAMDTGL